MKDCGNFIQQVQVILPLIILIYGVGTFFWKKVGILECKKQL